MSTNVMLLNTVLQEIDSTKNILNSTLTNPLSALNACPTNTALWNCLPLLTGGTSFNVCDTSGYYRCGASCTWTVPAGATKVQFQMWGAGAGTNGGACCGGSPFGDTGAYATVILNGVVPGCQYTICAGCALCMYAQSCLSTSAGQGCMSYVTGYGLTNFCAEGGAVGMYCSMLDQAIPNTSGYCVWHYGGGTTNQGPCICNAPNNDYYCFQSCATCGIIPVWQSARTYYGSSTLGFVSGLPSFHSGGCLDTNNYGYHLSQPIINTTNGVFTGTSCCASFTSSSCGGCNCSACAGYFQNPGSGGTMTHTMGGCNGNVGDAGRMGMVRVTYC